VLLQGIIAVGGELVTKLCDEMGPQSSSLRMHKLKHVQTVSLTHHHASVWSCPLHISCFCMVVSITHIMPLYGRVPYTYHASVWSCPLHISCLCMVVSLAHHCASVWFCPKLQGVIAVGGDGVWSARVEWVHASSLLPIAQKNKHRTPIPAGRHCCGWGWRVECACSVGPCILTIAYCPNK